MRRNRGTMRGMGSISRYIFWRTFGAFLVVLGSLTAVIWVTQAVYDIDLMRSPGQAILIFFGITGRIIPLLSALIALMIAVATAFGANTPWLPRWSPPADRFNVLTEHITQRFATS